MPPKHIVEQGYNRIAARYRDWASGVRIEERAKYTALLLNHLPPSAEVLELGCGAGVPTTQLLAEKFRVTGVDISAAQIALAEQNIPGAKFIQADMTVLDFLPASFDGVAAFYSLGHVPRDEQPQLLQSISAWLKPGGLFVASFGANGDPGAVEDEWLGAPMFFSSWDSETSQQLVQTAGLTILSATAETADEDGQPVTFLWTVAQKGSTDFAD